MLGLKSHVWHAIHFSNKWENVGIKSWRPLWLRHREDDLFFVNWMAIRLIMDIRKTIQNNEMTFVSLQLFSIFQHRTRLHKHCLLSNQIFQAEQNRTYFLNWALLQNNWLWLRSAHCLDLLVRIVFIYDRINLFKTRFVNEEFLIWILTNSFLKLKNWLFFLTWF